MEPPILFIHGTNAGPWTMANFAGYFKELGYSCLSPFYRYHDKRPSDENTKLLVGASIADYVDDVGAVVATLDRLPVLVGHSLGGIVAQKLAARGLARAIVLLNGSVNWGILPTTNEERALAKMLMSSGPFWEGTILPNFQTMVKFGLNKLDPAEQQRVFDRLGPESGRVMFELFFWMFDQNCTTKIDYDNVTCPVLMVSGSKDLAIPPSTSRLIAERYGSRATFHEAEGFGHYLMLEPHWKAIAAVSAQWIATAVT